MTGFPSVDVKSIGAGGGTIAWVDEGGLLHVGPQSAGAEPGPACYGRGGTAADGHRRVRRPRLHRPGLLPRRRDAARPGAARARRSTRDVADAARARRRRGGRGDPRARDRAHGRARSRRSRSTRASTRARRSLIGGGGAAGLNAVAIARRLGCRAVVIPEVGAALSAAGALMSDLARRLRGDAFADDRRLRLRRGQRGARGPATSAAEAFVDGPGARLASSRDRRSRSRPATRTRSGRSRCRCAASRFAAQDDVERAASATSTRVHEEIFAISDPRLARSSSSTWRARVRCRLRDDGAGRLERGARDGRIERRGRRLLRRRRQPVEATVQRLEALEPARRRRARRSSSRRSRRSSSTPARDRARRAERLSAIEPVAASRRSADARRAERRDRRARAGVARQPLRGRSCAAMTNTLLRTARSGVLNTARDFSCCILTADDELLAVAESLPIHVHRAAPT